MSNRRRAVVIAFVMCLLPAFSLAAAPKLLGVWKLTAVTTSQGPVPKEKLAGATVLWDFQKDGKCSIEVSAGPDKKRSDCTYSTNGKNLTIIENGKSQEMTFKASAKTLTLVNPAGSVTLTLTKQK
jgi:hypothetical protein